MTRVAVLCASLGVCALTAHANPLIIDGQPVAWPEDAWPIPLSDGDLDWRRAAADWTTGHAGFRPVGATPIGPDGVIALAHWDAVRWADDVGDAALLGFTLVTHEDGALRDADVVLNVDRYVFSDTPDLRSFHRPTTLAHELGHCLGLGHADAADALMHSAQEPGEVGAIDAASRAALAEVSTCCAAVRRPSVRTATSQVFTFADVEPGDFIRAHGGDGSDPVALPVSAVGEVEVPTGARAIEVWTAAGQGGVFAVPTDADAAPDAQVDAEALPDAGAMDAGADSMAKDGGCAQHAGSGAPRLWILGAILPLLGVWRRR